MSVINYRKEIRETRVFEFDKPIGKYKRWIRVSTNNKLDEWRPADSVDGFVPDEELSRKLELHYKRNYAEKKSDW